MFFTFSAILLSCSQQNTNKTEYKIDFSKLEESSIFDLFAKVELIPLIGDSSLLINIADKIVYYQQMYYLLDKRQSALFAFDSNGVFKFKIQNRGHGPREYTELYDFEINPYTQHIELLDPHGKLIIHGIDGRYIETIILPKELHALHYFKIISKNDVLFYRIFEDKRLVVYDRTNMKIKSEFYEVLKHVLTRNFATRLPLFNTEKGIGMWEGFSNSILNIDTVGNDLVNRYSWDFGDNRNINIEKIKSDRKYLNTYADMASHGGINNYIYPFYFNLESENYIFTQFGFDKKKYHIFLDKKKNVYKLFQNFKEGIMFSNFSSIIVPDGYVSLIYPMVNLNGYLNSMMLNEKDKKILSQIKIGDNPLLIKYTLKKNIFN